MKTQSAKRNVLTLALTGVFALLLSVIWWIEFGQTPATTMTNADINKIVITRNGHADIVLARENAAWRMTKPYALKANAQRIEPLLSLGLANFAGYDIAEVDMAASGLIAPDATITVGTRTFQLGLTDAQGERRYALVDNKVSFVPEWVWSLVHGGVTAFADLNVFAEFPADVYLHSDDVAGNDNVERNLGNVDEWRVLQADKIVAWPDERNTPAQVSFDRRRYSLSTSIQDVASDSFAEVVQFEKDTLINTQPGFAFAISTARMRELIGLQ